MGSSVEPIVSQVLELGQDEQGPFRRVRMSDGSERVQRPHVTVEAEHVHSDGRREDVSHLIDNVTIGGLPCE